MWVYYTDDYGVESKAKIQLIKEKRKLKSFFCRKDYFTERYYLVVQKRDGVCGWIPYIFRDITYETIILWDDDYTTHTNIKTVVSTLNDENYQAWLMTFANMDFARKYYEEQNQKRQEENERKRLDRTE